MNLLDEVMTLQEAAEKWKINDSTLRHSIKKGKLKSDEIKKSANTWLILKSAMTRLYGDMPIRLNIYTTGYEGKTIECFIDTLLLNNIDILIDVREIPNSRKKGFSKSALEKALKENNIKYVHFKELGSPKEIRVKLHKDNDYSYFFTEYRKYLNTQYETLDIINTAISNNKSLHFCLMCFEKNWEECHRSIVAERISQTLTDKVDIIHLD